MALDRGAGAPAPRKTGGPVVADRAERGNVGGNTARQLAPRVPHAKVPTAPPPPAVSPFGGGGGGGFGGPFESGSAFGGGAAAPAISDADWIKNGGDSAYAAQLAALNAALEQQLADLTHQQSDYETSFGDSLHSLGWQQAVLDNPDTPDVNEAMPGAWQTDDLNTAVGRATNNQKNDFASRGLLQSSLFAGANDDLMRSLNDQLSGVNKNRQSFLDDIARQQGSAKTQNDTATKQAQADALLRRAAGITL